ncbi:hypothetical protein [Zobellella aerophila]
MATTPEKQNRLLQKSPELEHSCSKQTDLPRKAGFGVDSLKGSH